MAPIRVLIADDSRLIRRILKERLSAAPDLEIVGEAVDADQTLELARTLAPDLVVLDLAFPRHRGFETLSRLRAIAPAIRVVLFSFLKGEAYVQEALRRGAQAYVTKSAPGAELLNAIRLAHQGRYYLGSLHNPPGISERLPLETEAADTGYDQLSEREQQVFRFLARGKTVSEIAALIGTDPCIVERLRRNIIHTLNINDPIALTRYAARIGLLPSGPGE